ncbi:DUF3857 domain-containing protein [Jiulongibacter sediminis]|uniref:DUF3857 domain-containing protein n=1 Tax=Jiulongibacter sediminis TaxID=1605367 RepID=A0A0P7C471_9BACT|nr:DUF3857 domain-containing protein [Jiulongibacter sediminis]KPM47989.1 hypothetical protein AFM12_12300 [Jiulongibacter sediminis]TBX24172.1 hypothetical protein TK44_12310 [Jiulongibacter sediminis]
MQKKHNFLLLLTLFCGLAQAQELEFGEVKPSEFTQTYSNLDSTASSIVLYDYGDSQFIYSPSRGFEIETLVHVRKKILKESALDEASINVNFFDESRTSGENIYKIKGATYNLENGEVVESKLGKKEVYYDRGERFSTKKFSLPDVKVGSIIEYTYIRQTPLNTYNKPRTWSFQSDKPVVWSEYNITIPSYFYYQIIMGGYLPLTVNEREQISMTIQGTDLMANAMKYRFAVGNAPAFKDEPYITTSSDYVSKVEFELSSISFPNQPVKDYNTTWEQLDKTLLESDRWGEGLLNQSFLKEEVAQFATMEDQSEKLKAIHAYLVKNYKWNKTVGLFPQENMRKVHSEKEGTASELNLLANAFLRSAGFSANPIILSTRNNGRINTVYPLMDKFNYTMACVNLDGKKILFDITDPLLPMGVIPAICINGFGREISEFGNEFVPLESAQGYYEYEEISATINPDDGIISGTYTTNELGYPANLLRKTFEEMDNEEFEEKIRENHSEWEISDFQSSNIENIDEAATISYKFSKEDGGVMPDIIYLSPLMTGQIKDNPFMRKERQFPVDFGHVTNQMVKAEYVIPEGFIVEELPKPATVMLPDKGGKFMYFVQNQNGKLTVFSRLNLFKSEYSAQEYAYLREFYDLIVEKHAEQIVLNRVEE